MKKKAHISLKWSLIILVTLCWITPVICLGRYCYVSYAKTVNEKIIDSVSREVEYAASISAVNVDSIIKSCMSVSYEGEISNIYYEYTINENLYDIKSKTERYLEKKFSQDPFVSRSILYYYKIDQTYVDSNEKNLTFSNDIFSRVLKKEFETADSDINFFTYNDNFYVMYKLHRSPFYEGSYASVVCEVSEEVFKTMYEHDVWNEVFEFQIYPTTGKAMTTTTTLYGKDTFEFNGVIAQDSFALKYRSIVLVEDLNEGMKNFLFLIFLLTIVAIPILIVTLVYFYRNFSRPLNRLIEAGNHLEKGDFSYRIEEDGLNREFAFLVKTFNAMTEKLNKLFEEIYKEEITTRDAKILALQSQINPHFLNNTLELMNWQARLSGDTTVSLMIEALSTLMDAALDRSGRRLIKLSDELNCADAYLYIIKQRFGKRITTSKEVDENVLDFYVPPLVIQPLLENAVEHGIEPVTNGKLDVKIYVEYSILNIDIINNGVELTDDDIKKINGLINGIGIEKRTSSTSLGIKNVNDRLQLIYGKNSNLSITKMENGDTLSKIVIPL